MDFRTPLAVLSPRLYLARWRLLACLLAVICASFSFFTTHTSAQATSRTARAANSGFVTRNGYQLQLNGKTFRFAGADLENLSIQYGAAQYSTPFQVDDTFATMNEMGETVARAYGLMLSVGCPRCVRPTLNSFNETALKSVDYALASADAHGIRLIVPLVEGIPNGNWTGDIGTYASWRGLSNSTDFYTNSTVISDFELTIRTLLNRVNTITGVAYKNDPAILSWETVNEGDNRPDSWLSTISTYIKSIDGNHLVMDGLFSATPSNTAYGFSSVDIYTRHYYPLSSSNSQNTAAADAARAHNKAFIAGEFGWESQDVSTTTLSSALGAFENDPAMSGDLYWELDPHNDTYGFRPLMSGFGESTNLQYELFYPGGNSDTRIRAQLLRTHAYHMAGQSNPPAHMLPGAPLITSVNGQQIYWRGTAATDTYSIERATAGSNGPWSVVCNQCATDFTNPWTDSSQPSSNLWYRVRAYNLDNVAGPYSPVYQVSAPRLADDSNAGTGLSQFDYHGSGWTHATNYSSAGYFGNSVSYDHNANDYVQVTFSGTQVSFYGGVNTTTGIAALSLDGGSETLVDTYNQGNGFGDGSDQGNVLIWTSSILSSGQHTLKIRVTGNKNAASSDSWVATDFVAICSACGTGSTVTTIDDTVTGSGNNQFNYQGSGWGNATGYSGYGYYNNSEHYDNLANDYATITFTGTQVRVYVGENTTTGYIALSLDGGSETTLDTYANTYDQGNMLIWTSPALSSGTHTLKLRVTGTKDTNANDSYIGIDRVDIIS
jgi:hypothetical protein